jgi:3-oxoacyl-[acyl-carrier protein] reductase
MLNLDLKNRTAIVTGATGQLGRVIIATLANCGADVIIHYNKNEEKANELAKSISDKEGVRTYIAKADVGSFESVKEMGKNILNEFKMPDIVVDCAVEQYKWTNVLEQNIEDYEGQFRSCVLHNVNMAKIFVPNMIDKKYGRFIGINTECSMQNHPNQSAYVSGKRGMDGIFRVLAREVGMHNITVNQVAPGWTISDNDRRNHTERSPEYEKHVALSRRGTDQEIANVVAFVASDLSSFITGAYIPVCGGYIMPSI